jgi:hypothetical protein
MTEDKKCELCGDLEENLHLTVTGVIGGNEVYNGGLCIKPEHQTVEHLRDFGRTLGLAAASSLMKTIDMDAWHKFYDPVDIPSTTDNS